MAIMDPLLNTGFLWRCLAAYAGIKSDNEPPNDEISSATITTTDTAPEQDGQIKLERKQSFQDSDHMRQDTYYTRLSTESLHLSTKNFNHFLLADIVGSRQAYLLRKLRESPLPNHPHMSPLRASDDILRQFPTTYLIVSFLFFVDYLFSSVACWSRQLHFESTKNTFHHFRHVILTHYWMIR